MLPEVVTMPLAGDVQPPCVACYRGAAPINRAVMNGDTVTV